MNRSTAAAALLTAALLPLHALAGGPPTADPQQVNPTFDTTGSFPYRCGPHPRMTGTVHVTD